MTPLCAVNAASVPDQGVLRFTINQYVLEGASLLSQREVDAVVAPYVGADKDFSDVQRALEAVESAYAKRGFTAVRVLLPEQELEKGTVRFRVVESRLGKVTVMENRFVSRENALNALPSVRSGAIPRSKQISRELKLANENPSRQMNVVLKASALEDQVDANVVVTDTKPAAWGISADNTGSPETGRSRLGFSYRNANAFNADHLASVQYVTSPQHTDRVKVLGGSYKIPFYQAGGSLEFFGGYSNVNAVIGGLSNFQGGGRLLSTRYNHNFARLGAFDSRLSFGLDWRDFQRIELTSPSPTVLYNEIVVMPVSLTYATTGKFSRSNVNFNVALAANLPKASQGKDADFAAYDRINQTQPEPAYRVLRYGAGYTQLIGEDWQLRANLVGQSSSDVLVQGEQMRLGGADAVRGFSEGSEGSESAKRLNIEAYTPSFGPGKWQTRGLVFYDAGQADASNAATGNADKTTISAVGVGLRLNYGESVSLRCDVAKIVKDGTDPEQQSGDKRVHLSLNVTL